jgi:hypothetical protein
VNRMLLPLGAASLVSLALPMAGTALNDERKAEVKIFKSSYGAASHRGDKNPGLAAASAPPGLKGPQHTDQMWTTVTPPAGETILPTGSPRCVAWTSETHPPIRCAAPFPDPQEGEVGGAKWH